MNSKKNHNADDMYPKETILLEELNEDERAEKLRKFVRPKLQDEINIYLSCMKEIQKEHSDSDIQARAKRIERLLKQLPAVLKRGNVEGAILIGWDVGAFSEQLFAKLDYEPDYICGRRVADGRDKSQKMRLPPIEKRNVEIIEKMGDKIARRGNRKQPSNEAIRKKLASEYDISLRQVFKITKKFNIKK